LARARTTRSDVFINVPFDAVYENTFLALIASLVGLGLNPRCVLEVPPAVDRLRRLYSLIRSCPFSLHDLSRVQVGRTGPFRVPRFNMPFELGLAAAISLADDQHQWRVLECVPHRVAQSLSDIAGYDATIHNGTVRGTIDAVLDIFGNVADPPLSETEDLFWVYRRLSRYRSTVSTGVYRPNSFKRLVLAAKGFVIERARSA
jgi:hypothetical protein